MIGAGPVAHQGARHLLLGLRAALAALALLTAVLAVVQLASQLRVLTHWPRQAATVEGLADEAMLELELPAAAQAQWPNLRQPPYPTPLREDHVRVLVPRPPYFGGDLRDTVDLAVDPDDPAQVRVLEPVSLWLPLLAKGLLLALLGLAWRGLRHLQWGDDLTWQQGRWLDTAQVAPRPAAHALPAQQLAEPLVLRRVTRFWAALFALLTMGVTVGGALDFAALPLEVGATWVVVAAFDLMVLHVALSAHTRRIAFDAVGVADTGFFATRRVPWAEVAGFERVNAAREEQAAYERDFRRPGNRTRGRMRPRNRFEWTLADRSGQVLLRLPAEMESEPAFAALRAHLPAGSASIPLPEVMRPASAARAAAQAPMHNPGRMHRGALAIALAVTLAPFVLGTVWATARTLWFIGFADRAVGTVVTVHRDPLPSLVVTYETADGRTLRLESDGSDAYAGFEEGDRVTVLHDPGDAGVARLDLFLELWLWPLIGLGLTLLAGLPLTLMARAMARTRP